MTDLPEEFLQAFEKNDIEKMVSLTEERLGVKLLSKKPPERWTSDPGDTKESPVTSHLDPAMPPGEVIRIQLEVEDRYKSGVIVELDAPKGITILKLKQLIRERYGFPPECQTLIINERMAEDKHKLSAYRDTHVYLYLKPIKQSHLLSTSQSLRNLSRGTSSNFNTSLDQQSPELIHQTSDSSSTGVFIRVTHDNHMISSSSPHTINSISQFIAASDVNVNEEVENKWPCASCTFLNRTDDLRCVECLEPRPSYVQ